jgi:hypothetical protein
MGAQFMKARGDVEAISRQTLGGNVISSTRHAFTSEEMKALVDAFEEG